jgi:hypothetical protein
MYCSSRSPWKLELPARLVPSARAFTPKVLSLASVPDTARSSSLDAPKRCHDWWPSRPPQPWCARAPPAAEIRPPPLHLQRRWALLRDALGLLFPFRASAEPLDARSPGDHECQELSFPPHAFLSVTSQRLKKIRLFCYEALVFLLIFILFSCVLVNLQITPYRDPTSTHKSHPAIL